MEQPDDDSEVDQAWLDSIPLREIRHKDGSYAVFSDHLMESFSADGQCWLHHSMTRGLVRFLMREATEHGDSIIGGK